jgi:S1-C subfamily serine protease
MPDPGKTERGPHPKPDETQDLKPRGESPQRLANIQALVRLSPIARQRLGLVGLGMLLAILLTSLWKALFGWTTDHAVDHRHHVSGHRQPPAGDVSLAVLSQASARIADHVRGAVVRINAQHISRDAAVDTEFAQLFGSLPRTDFGQGSGVIVEPDGYILTNYHVVQSASRVEVVTGDQRRYEAQLIGVDALTDLAVLKIQADGLNRATWGDSDALDVGSFVWAVGNPFGLEGSVSFGIVSAKNRDGVSESAFQDFVQTDAAINPGNSGGPLVDAAGHVVGINTAIIGQRFQGVSFAIPSKTAREVFRRLREQGYVARGWLGVTLDALTSEQAAQASVKPGGVYVRAVSTDGLNQSPAHKAGIRPGDIIVKWNGQPIADPIRLSRLVAQTRIGSRALVAVIRDGQPLELEVVIQQRRL